MSSEQRQPLLWWETGAIGLSAVAFVALRWPLYTEPGVRLGWNSDAALFGLLARRIAAGDFAWFFPGQDYLGALTAFFAAAVGTTMTSAVGPLALRVGTSLEFLVAIVFFHAALRHVVGPAAASLATLLLAAGPAFFFKLSYAPLGAEQYFFVAAILFWLVMRTPVVRLHHWMILGLLSGLGWWQHRGVVFVILPALVVMAWYDRPLVAVRDFVAGLCVFAAAMALGLLPIVFGRLAVDQRIYVPIRPGWSLAHVRERIADTITHDFWRLIGAEPSSWMFGVTLVVLLAMAVRHFEPRRETTFAASVIIVSFAFWLLSTEAYRGAVRYVMIAVPILYAFAAREIVRIGERRRAAAIALSALLIAGVYVPRAFDAREVAAARREQHELWPGGFDPRPTLDALAEGRYTVCYADFWLAYKLEWLSTFPVRFIPYRSVNRTMVESLRLAGQPGPKCFVDLTGNVHPLTGRQLEDLRLDTLWHVHGWPRAAQPVPW